jgi:lipopolysaccharide biosynthesis protein
LTPITPSKPTANDPATAKTIHSTIRWNKIADVGVMVDSKVRHLLPQNFQKKTSQKTQCAECARRRVAPVAIASMTHPEVS